MKALVLRLDAPLLSFGSVIVDQHGFIDRFPRTSMLTGLLANALGWHHTDFEKLEELQRRIIYAARWDVPPEELVDYHTVDLGQTKMREAGWTTRGTPEHRTGGPDAKFGIHQRYRHYWTDGLLTLVLGLRNELSPHLSISELYEALLRPARPLFLGRKTCLPARPILDPQMPVAKGENVLAILKQVPVWDRHGVPVEHSGEWMACWPGELGTTPRSQVRSVYDIRDWANQLVVGPSQRVEGWIGGEVPNESFVHG